MLERYLILLLFTFISMHTFSQTTLIGKWRRVTSNPHYQDTTHKQLEYGDLEIHSDATFHIEGDSVARNSTIPGWNVGTDMNGIWELQDDNRRLTLWLEPKGSQMFLNFVIIKITEQELVLRSHFERNNKKADVKYLRL